MNLNESEASDFVIGFIYGIFSVIAISWWCIPVAFITATLYTLGGIGFLGWNGWRRIIMPIVLCGIFIAHHFTWWIVGSFFLQWASLSIGYGEVDVNDPKGSFLGRLCGKWTRYVWWAILGVAMTPLVMGG